MHSSTHQVGMGRSNARRIEKSEKKEKVLMLRKSLQDLQQQVNDYLECIGDESTFTLLAPAKDNNNNNLPFGENNDLIPIKSHVSQKSSNILSGAKVKPSDDEDDVTLLDSECDASAWFVTPCTTQKIDLKDTRRRFPHPQSVGKTHVNNGSLLDNSDSQFFFPLNSTLRHGRQHPLKLEFSSILHETPAKKTIFDSVKQGTTSKYPPLKRQMAASDLKFPEVFKLNNVQATAKTPHRAAKDQRESMDQTLEFQPTCCIGSVVKMMSGSMKRRKRKHQQMASSSRDKENFEPENPSWQVRSLSGITHFKKTSSTSSLASSSYNSARKKLIVEKLKRYRRCLQDKKQDSKNFVELGDL